MMFTVAPVTAQSKPAFSIDRILGLELEKPGNCLTLHRPWTGKEQKFNLNLFLYKLSALKSHGHTLYWQRTNTVAFNMYWRKKYSIILVSYKYLSKSAD